MAYVIRYWSRAREEVDFFRATYGSDFSQEFDRWLQVLAEAAERGDRSISADALEALEEAQGVPPPKSQWEYSWQQFTKAGGNEMLKMALAVLKHRCPPWEFLMSGRWFRLLDFIPAEIQVYYVVDRANQRVIFAKFELVDHRSPGGALQW